MIKYEESKLETEKALEIANKLLEVFKYCVEAIPIILTSYPCYYDEELNKEREERSFCTTINLNDRTNNVKLKKVRKESEEDLYNKYNTYYIYYKTHNYQIKFFDSPEACGSGEDPNYNEETDMFCSIELLNSKNEAVYEMNFTFNVINMEFIELYSLSRTYRKKETYKLSKSKVYIKESGKIIVKKINSSSSEELNRNLQKRILVDFSKLININPKV